MVEGGCGGSKYFIMQSNGQEVVPGRSHEFASLPSPERNDDPASDGAKRRRICFTPIAGKPFAAL